jgi:uroporphyrinogen-III decarboxylase
MTSRERLFAALEGRSPDRVPMMEMYIDPKIIHAICPGMSYEDFIDYADLDAVMCWTMVEDPANRHWVDRQKGLWRDKWGALQIQTFDAMSVVTTPARIETEADLTDYEPPDPARAPVLQQAKRLVERFKGKRAIVVIGEECFAPSQYLRAGLEPLMVDYVERPEFVKKLARIGVDYHVELYRKLIAEGVEVVLLGDDYAGKTGPFMSPGHFQQFILPGLQTVVRAVKDAGAYCIHHTDGDIWKILDLLVSTGLDALGPLEPAYMRLDEVRRHTRGKVAVIGNVDVDLLSRGSVAEVRAATRELLERVSPLGGHILSSGNTISSSVRPENFLAMLETVKQNQ